MKTRIKNRIVTLLNSDVVNCRKNCANILNNIREVSYKYNRYSYYLTFLIIMHVMTGDILEQFDPDVLQKIFDNITMKDGNAPSKSIEQQNRAD